MDYIHSPLIAYKDFFPDFEMGCKGTGKPFMSLKSWNNPKYTVPNDAYMFVRPRKMWATVFTATAREEFAKRNETCNDKKNQEEK